MSAKNNLATELCASRLIAVNCPGAPTTARTTAVRDRGDHAPVHDRSKRWSDLSHCQTGVIQTFEP
jgi:hypothetical protein